MMCHGCGADAPVVAPNASAPWMLRSTALISGRDHAIAASLIGERGWRAPLYMQGTGDTTGAMRPWSWAALDETGLSWTVNVRAERTVFRHRHGATVSVFGNVYLPIQSGGTGSSGPLPISAEAALMVGVNVRW